MRLPERDQLIAAVKGIRDDSCSICDCKDRPNFHEQNCNGTAPVQLRVDEEDWEITPVANDEIPEDEAVYGESTVGFDDDDDVIGHIVDQLLHEVHAYAVDADLMEEDAELIEWG